MTTIESLIADQASHKRAMRIFPVTPRKQRKVLKQADIVAAVAAAFDDMDRELRRLGVEFPRQRTAFDVARASLARIKGGAE